MVAGPFFAKGAEALAARFERPAPEPDGAAEPPPSIPKEKRGKVLVVGFGRFGQIAVQPLLAERIDVTVIDTSIKRIRDAGKFGFKVYFGDGCRLDVLRSAGAAEARIIAICVGNRDIANSIVALARDNFPVAKVFVRAYDRIHAIDLLERGADFQIRETLELASSFGGAAIAELRGDPDARPRGGGGGAQPRHGPARDPAGRRVAAALLLRRPAALQAGASGRPAGKSKGLTPGKPDHRRSGRRLRFL